MSKVTLTLHGKEYIVACPEGQEGRLHDVAAYVNDLMGKTANNAVGASDLRLFMLTCLILADELLETRRVANGEALENEELFVHAVQHLKERIAGITSQVGGV